MKPWWKRSPEEQARLREWATRELRALEAERVREADARARAEYWERRRGAACVRCTGLGRIEVWVHPPGRPPEGRAVPCGTCRPEDAAATAEMLRRGAA